MDRSLPKKQNDFVAALKTLIQKLENKEQQQKRRQIKRIPAKVKR